MIGTNSEIVKLRELINSLYSIGQYNLTAGVSEGEQEAGIEQVRRTAREVAALASAIQQKTK